MFFKKFILYRLTINESADAKLDFIPPQAGKFIYKLYFMCDSYLGADQEFEISVKVDGIQLLFYEFF